MIGPEKPPLCAILCSESTPQKRRGSEGPFGIDSMKAAENCGDIQTLPTRQKRSTCLAGASFLGSAVCKAAPLPWFHIPDKMRDETSGCVLKYRRGGPHA